MVFGLNCFWAVSVEVFVWVGFGARGDTAYTKKCGRMQIEHEPNTAFDVV